MGKVRILGIRKRINRTSCVMENVYDFRSDWYSDGRSERVVCVGRRSFIEQFIPHREFSELFGGYVLLVDSSGEEFLGVWARRKGQRFRHILRLRGAQFVMSTDIPPLRRIVTSP